MDHYPVYEFHVSRNARDRYAFDQSLYSSRGTVVFPNFPAARAFAHRMSEHRATQGGRSGPVTAGQVNAIALIHELMHVVVRRYLETHNPAALAQALAAVEKEVGTASTNQTLERFALDFPPMSIYRGDIQVPVYLQSTTEGVSNREILLEELLLLWLGAVNPAFATIGELFDDSHLATMTAYPKIISGLHEHFRGEGSKNEELGSLIDLLRAPAMASPNDLLGQLSYIKEHWGLAGNALVLELLASLDLIREETKPRFGGGPGPSEVLRFDSGRGVDGGTGGGAGGGTAFEEERFSEDVEWMPRLVMIAKSTYVWLDQLSKQYGRPIYRLDQIPDEELDMLARRGITGLWLIGIWNRSTASQKIKRLCGNPEAIASAYSLLDYEVAHDLGGDEGYQSLHDRAWQRGIRLASDMVPNHMGIDATWVMEHPEWFVSVASSPFPSYSFNGPDLSRDPNIGIYLEDHYYSQSDAAVVFKRVDRRTGEERFIYHGNDGTSMPWNDTAQLNYIDPHVREMVIQTILQVARKFPVIRFDAAMVLAKRHIERLWYPEPGHGGDIASRSEHAMSQAEFNRAMPNEFWREVVDRVAQEVPNTLLLAEAFWMMEPYFVRTLGMHRVYNSAFMNMLKNEENAKYRATIKNTLEFDPEILKRFVNFLNNPDERTAVEQFGKGDKYFGVTVLLATLPGLPMLGHGQVEGFAEKYGMEYRRAYLDERPDQWLVERHERDIFPLLHRRYLFANVDQFLLYDFVTPAGHVDENVFAYSNRAGDERSLVVYHNVYGSTSGTMRQSVPYSVKGAGDERVLMQKSLAVGLGLHHGNQYWSIFRDSIGGLEYLRSNRELSEQGLTVHLDAYTYHVYLDWREVEDHDGRYGQLAAELQGRGVPNVEHALRQLSLEPVHRAFRELANAGLWRWVIDQRRAVGRGVPDSVLEQIEAKTVVLLNAASEYIGTGGDVPTVAHVVRRTFARLMDVPTIRPVLTLPQDDARGTLPANVTTSGAPTEKGTALGGVNGPTAPSARDEDLCNWGIALGWVSVFALGRLTGTADTAERSRLWFEEWMLDRSVADALRNLGVAEGEVWRSVVMVNVLTAHQGWFAADTGREGQEDRLRSIAQRLFSDPAVQQVVGLNVHGGIRWFSKEIWEELLAWLAVVAMVQGDAKSDKQTTTDAELPLGMMRRLASMAAEAGYQVDRLLAGPEKPVPVGAKDERTT
ncbi:MAG: alpha-amylase family glycosyl hydrolase [Herpetosiphon sp.]